MVGDGPLALSLPPPPLTPCRSPLSDNNGGTVRDVLFQDFGVHGTNQGAGVKIGRATSDATGGLVSNVSFVNYHIFEPRYAPLYANAFAEDAASCALPAKPNRKDWLTFQNFTLRHCE